MTDEDDFGAMADAASASRAAIETKYGVIAMDPPWPETGGGKIKRGADKHYDVIRRPSDLVEVIVRAPCYRPADDALLFMFSTMMSLERSVWLMNALGWKLTTHSVWVKSDEPTAAAIEAEELQHLDMGIGQYFRGSHELLLVGVRGSGYAVKSAARDIPSVIYARTRTGEGRIHSRKPDKIYRMIEARTVAERRLDMFARVPRGPTWDVWGAEAPDPDGLEAT